MLHNSVIVDIYVLNFPKCVIFCKTKDKCQCKLFAWIIDNVVILFHQFKGYVTLTKDVDIRGNWKDIWKLSSLSAQFFCKHKTQTLLVKTGKNNQPRYSLMEGWSTELGKSIQLQRQITSRPWNPI